MMIAPTAAIILAGGRATRLGGVDKPSLMVGGVSLLERVVNAAAGAGCAPIVIVGGTQHAHPDTILVRESPPFGGPVAAIGAALPLVSTPTVLLLAADLPWADALVPALMAAPIPSGADGVCAVDDSGREQWLAGRYRIEAIRDAVGQLPNGGSDASMRSLLATLTIATAPAPSGAADDVDRWQDVARARRTASATPKELSMTLASRTPDSRTLPPEALTEWAAALRVELGLTSEQLPTAAILDLARDVANGVARPAAPFSAFAAGLAAGMRGGDTEAIAASIEAVTALAADWSRDVSADVEESIDEVAP